MRIISVLFSLLSFILVTLGQQNGLLSSKVRQSLIGHLIDDIQSSEKVIFQNAVFISILEFQVHYVHFYSRRIVVFKKFENILKNLKIFLKNLKIFLKNLKLFLKILKTILKILNIFLKIWKYFKKFENIFEKIENIFEIFKNIF